MASTGDMKNNVKQLQAELKAVKYSGTMDIDGLVSGLPKTYLPFYHYLFTTYSTKLNKDISNSNNELYGKSDMRFMEAVYKILRDMFQHKPQVTRDQFFSPGFAERKVIMATEILRLVRSKYKPPKTSSAFRVTATKDHRPSSHPEKVRQEPRVPSSAKERPRKVAARSIPDVSGAIVLPSQATASAANGFCIPKSAFPQLRMAQLAPTRDQAEPVPSDSDSDLDTATVTESSSGRILASLPAGTIGQSEMEAEIRRKVVGMVSPSLVNLNERLGKLEIALKRMDQQEVPKPPPEPAQFKALTTGLTKQMNDVIFKLDTLTSRVVLIENRLTMVETKLDDETAYHRTLAASRAVTSGSSKTRNAGHHSRQSPRIVQVRAEDEEAFLSSAGKEELGAKVVESHGEVINIEDGDINADADGAGGEKVDVVVVREEVDRDTRTDNKMGFIKTLVGNNGSETTLTTGDNSTVDIAEDQIPSFGRFELESMPVQTVASIDNSQRACTLEREAARDLISTLPTTAATRDNPPISSLTNAFGDLASPIRPFVRPQYEYPLLQDDSVISIPCATYEDSSEDRRTSTPSHATLDTSTLDRVGRINQMMCETQQLFR
ncbi:uncharacterized protein LOC101850644 [Aplysia californica]|uniref:Centrosomal protein of 44 kDa n=1 Tax=Aplysia californica TaxID=6500 RepID=A0ABM0JMI5_APLCA|nr:uncharacterized protein LOC101850644 [Aplysia californica]